MCSCYSSSSIGWTRWLLMTWINSSGLDSVSCSTSTYFPGMSGFSSLMWIWLTEDQVLKAFADTHGNVVCTAAGQHAVVSLAGSLVGQLVVWLAGDATISPEYLQWYETCLYTGHDKWFSLPGFLWLQKWTGAHTLNPFTCEGFIKVSTALEPLKLWTGLQPMIISIID